MMSVLEAPPPRFAPDEVADIAARLFGVEGTARNLGSERDQTFLIDDGAGGGGVIKISNLGEDPDVLDLETQAIMHVAHVDPELPVARPRPAGADYRPTVDGPDGVHFVRLFERVRGHTGGPELFAATGPDEVARELGAPAQTVPTAELVRRRHRLLGPALTELTYEHPVHVVRGEGVWLFDADGRRLLDAYNNVPVVGHCHPRVTEAVVRQTRLLNTHARYLYEPLIELAERLASTMPPGPGLDTVMLVNSGSEANEIAWRLALASTGKHGAVVTDHAYHGVTTAISDLSPEEWPQGFRPPNVETIEPPGAGEAVHAEMARATRELTDRGVGLA